ncbi:hypothetical protein D3C76_439390 [compost metagenome]
MDAGPGAYVQHMIGEANGVLVVLHHYHGVAEVAQVSEGLEQPFVVPLVQADAGFIQHIHDPH